MGYTLSWFISDNVAKNVSNSFIRSNSFTQVVWVDVGIHRRDPSNLFWLGIQRGGLSQGVREPKGVDSVLNFYPLKPAQ